jgi:hypothetical protein
MQAIDQAMQQLRTLITGQADQLAAARRLNNELGARVALLEAENRGLRASIAAASGPANAPATPCLSL